MFIYPSDEKHDTYNPLKEIQMQQVQKHNNIFEAKMQHVCIVEQNFKTIL